MITMWKIFDNIVVKLLTDELVNTCWKIADNELANTIWKILAREK